jgi:hypothetical protein
MSENGKRWESGQMDLCHIEKGPARENTIFRTPPPPSLKADRSGGSEKYHQSSIGVPATRS